MEILHLRNQEIEVHNDNELLTKEKEKCLQLYESLFSVQNGKNLKLLNIRLDK